MAAGIYVVGMASVYAGAKDLREFWETVLTRRCGFREFPQQRLNLNEYGSESRDDRDKTYIKRAALIDGFEFDWKAHRVPKAAFEATDPVHWLALTTAMQAIEDGGIDLDAVGRERIGVILGNSLTGEVSRANLLRLRWPYVRRSIVDGAARVGLQGAELTALIGEIEQSFKAAFPVPNEDTLAGALSNVIAGRICNVLDLNGGGYVVERGLRIFTTGGKFGLRGPGIRTPGYGGGRRSGYQFRSLGNGGFCAYRGSYRRADARLR